MNLNDRYLASELEMVEGSIEGGRSSERFSVILKQHYRFRWVLGRMTAERPGLPLFLTTKILFGHPWFRREEDESVGSV